MDYTVRGIEWWIREFARLQDPVFKIQERDLSVFILSLSLYFYKIWAQDPKHQKFRDNREFFIFNDEDNSITRFELKFFHEFPRTETPGSFIVPFIEGG